MTRFLATACTELVVDLGRSFEMCERPLAIVLGRRGGSIQTNVDLLGNTRLDAVSTEVRAFGIEPGATIAGARARCTDLVVRVVRNEVICAALARIAETLLEFGPTTAIDDEAFVVWVDITGCAALFGGEAELASKLASRIAELGHRCRIAIADGPRLARALALHAATYEMPFIAPAGEGRGALDGLPIRALSLGDDLERWLFRLGLHTVGDLGRMPKKALLLRLGDRAREIASFLDGDDRVLPKPPYEPPVVIEERHDLDDGVSSIDALIFVSKRLCDRLASRLAGRGAAVSKLELEFSLDRAFLGDLQESKLELSIDFAKPHAESADLLRFIKTKLETSFEMSPLAAPVRALVLRAPMLVSNAPRQRDLFHRETKAVDALHRLVSELEIALGRENVGVLELCDRWEPASRSHVAPIGMRGERDPAALVSSTLEPTRMLASPKLVLASARPRDLHLLLRLEFIEWWRTDVSSRRDHVAAWIFDDFGWLEIDRKERTVRLLGWLD